MPSARTPRQCPSSRAELACPQAHAQAERSAPTARDRTVCASFCWLMREKAYGCSTALGTQQDTAHLGADSAKALVVVDAGKARRTLRAQHSVRRAYDPVVETHARLAHLLDRNLDIELVVEACRSSVPQRQLDDRQVQPAPGPLCVRDFASSEPLDSRDLHVRNV